MKRITRSLAMKMTIIVTLEMALAITVSSFFAIRTLGNHTTNVIMDYAQSLAENAVTNMENAKYGGVELDSSTIGSMITPIKMKGLSSSYAFMCAADGTIMSHPDSSKIGTMVSNEVIRNVVARIAKGEHVEGAGAIYVYNGSKKITGYAISSANEIVVVCVDNDEATASVSTVRKRTIGINISLCLAIAIALFFICRAFFKPVKQICDVVEKTADFNFVAQPIMDVLCKRTDELGSIAASVREMRNSLREMVRNIEDSSESITTNISEAKAATDEVNTMCTDNSATTQQIAAGMEETSATTGNIYESIEKMLENARNIDDLAVDGTKLSADVNKRAEELKDTTVNATKKTEAIYENVRTKANEAIEEAKDVDKINEMTNTIMEISSQTSLLALNASIEAARAGESGRGFAVVATEIGNLATQTSKTVADIEEMVNGVVAAVGRMQDCLEETTTFIGENVINDYREFGKISEQYQADAGSFRDSMGTIRTGISSLKEAIDAVADSISGINTTIAEAARGVTGIANNTSDIVVMTESTADKVDACRQEIMKLDEVVARFTLE